MADLTTIQAHNSNNTSIAAAVLTKNMNPQMDCRFFTIAAELRNHIYNLVFFGTDADANPTVALHHANPPSKSLILTCKAAYAQAHNIHAHNYRNYWKSTHFHIERPLEPDLQHAIVAGIQKLKPEDLIKIQLYVSTELDNIYENRVRKRRNQAGKVCQWGHSMAHWDWRVKDEKPQLSFAYHLREAWMAVTDEVPGPVDEAVLMQRQLVTAVQMQFEVIE